MIAQVLLVLGLAATTFAFPEELYGDNGRLDHHVNPKYNFDYGVSAHKTGDNKNQWEARDGDVVKGAYSLHEADGILRVVEYTADKHNGFNAVVHRQGKAVHPHHYAPVYHHGGYATGHGDARYSSFTSCAKRNNIAIGRGVVAYGVSRHHFGSRVNGGYGTGLEEHHGGASSHTNGNSITLRLVESH